MMNKFSLLFSSAGTDNQIICIPYIYGELPIIFQRFYSYHVGFNFFHPLPTF